MIWIQPLWTLASRFVSSLWMAIFSGRPAIVGGCRPIRLEPYVDIEQGQMEQQHILTPFGVPSEVPVLIADDESPGMDIVSVVF